MKIQIRTLQQKTFMFVLIPTFLFLSALGWGGYLFAKQSLLSQWSKTADANLQKAAHLVDMRLARPKDLLDRLKYASGTGMAHLTLRFTLEQLEKLDGVTAVNTNLSSSMPGMMPMMREGDGHHSSEPLNISSPEYTWDNVESTVSLTSTITNPVNGEHGSITVMVNVEDLVDLIAREDWWTGSKALLTDMTGNIIAQSSHDSEPVTASTARKFGENGFLEKNTLQALQVKTHGTVFGEGNPPTEISGFYRLSDAPWSMVVIAPGEVVLQPINKFRLYYGLLFVTAIIVIIVFIRSMTTQMTKSIQKVSVAAENLANGVFGPPLPVQSKDEIGELTTSFNTMTAQLKQGVVLQKAMDIAREVQQNFLPDSKYIDEAMEIYGFCRYSQETGGDFFDFITSGDRCNKVGVVVGDVVGHGVGAALFMASVRAILRARIDHGGDTAQVLTDVNRVLCADTEENSNFVTLFYLVVDKAEKTIEWVRAGHDPALLLYPDRQDCVELYGKGVAAGIDKNLKYVSSSVEITAENQLVVIGSDGAWEAENARGERFGKKRLLDLLLTNSKEQPEVIVSRINEEIDLFLDGVQPQDDITFVVLKIDGKSLR